MILNAIAQAEQCHFTSVMLQPTYTGYRIYRDIETKRMVSPTPNRKPEKEEVIKKSTFSNQHHRSALAMVFSLASQAIMM